MNHLGNRGYIGLLLVIGCAAILFLSGLGRLPVFGRDEALYAEAGREMLATGDWVTPRVNGAPFLEKPPLYYWLAAGSYRLLGATPFAARLPSALLALLTVALTVGIGARAWGARAGALSGLALAASLQMAFAGRMGIMDVPLTAFTVLALLAYARWRRQGDLASAAGFGLALALALLMKGMAGLIPLAAAALHLLLWRRPPLRIRPAGAIVSLLAFAAVVLPPFVAMARHNPETFVSILFLREHLTRVLHPMQGHGGPVVYYLLVIAVSFFPWVVFLPAAVRARPRPDDDRALFWYTLSLVWIAVVLLPFSLVRTKLPGYVTPLFPAMALLVGAELDRRLSRPGRAPWIAIILGSVVLGTLVSLLPALGARLAGRVGASDAVRLLVIPVLVWMVGYAIIALGAGAALVSRLRLGLGLIIGGQALALAAVLAGILPVVSPYFGGAEAQLARLAERELPHSQLVLYEVRPETVAFALQRPVPAFGDDEREQVLARMRAAPTALLLPVGERAFWRGLPARRTWRGGGRLLLDIPRLEEDNHLAP